MPFGYIGQEPTANQNVKNEWCFVIFRGISLLEQNQGRNVVVPMSL